MDILLEKQEIINRLNLVTDINLIESIKNLLDTGISNLIDNEVALHSSIDRAIKDSNNGRVRPYEEFIAEVRNKYRA